VTFDLASAVTDIDPNATLIFRLSTFAELFGPSNLNGGITSVPCPSGVEYDPGGTPSGQPPGFSVSKAGLVTWNTTLIQPAITGGNCGFGAPVAGDLWPAQIMVEAVNENNVLITEIPVDLLMEFVNPVGALPTMVLSPSGTQTIEVGSTVTFTATGNSTNAGTKVTLNASGVPPGATATGLNATVTPPATSNFSWTPTAGQTGTFVVSYTVTDSNLQQATASETIVVANLPTVTCSSPITVTYGQTGTLTSTLYDPSNYPLNIVWTVDGASVQTNSGVVAYPSPATVGLTANFGVVGTHVIKATATEPTGVEVSCTTSANVVQAPVLITLSNLTQNYSGSPEGVTVSTTPVGLGITTSYTGVAPTSYGPSTTAPTNPGSYAVVSTERDGLGGWNVQLLSCGGRVDGGVASVVCNLHANGYVRLHHSKCNRESHSRTGGSYCHGKQHFAGLRRNARPDCYHHRLCERGSVFGGYRRTDPGHDCNFHQRAGNLSHHHRAGNAGGCQLHLQPGGWNGYGDLPRPFPAATAYAMALTTGPIMAT
jgi:hypothetical protein